MKFYKLKKDMFLNVIISDNDSMLKEKNLKALSEIKKYNLFFKKGSVIYINEKFDIGVFLYKVMQDDNTYNGYEFIALTLIEFTRTSAEWEYYTPFVVGEFEFSEKTQLKSKYKYSTIENISGLLYHIAFEHYAKDGFGNYIKSKDKIFWNLHNLQKIQDYQTEKEITECIQLVSVKGHFFKREDNIVYNEIDYRIKEITIKNGIPYLSFYENYDSDTNKTFKQPRNKVKEKEVVKENDTEQELSEEAKASIEKLDFEKKARRFFFRMSKFLISKNMKYGNAALEPINIFSKDDASTGIYKRIDDKLSRIKNNGVNKNDLIDLIGYLSLEAISKDWIELKDIID